MFPSLSELCCQVIIEFNIKPIGLPKLIKYDLINNYKKQNRNTIFKLSKSYNKVFIPYKCQSMLQKNQYGGFEYIDIINLTNKQRLIFSRKTTFIK
jgi:hypothetical protein